MKRVRISKFSDPAKGGRSVEFLSSSRHTTVRWPGYTSETHSENWIHAGVLMDPIENHVPEQPTNRWKRVLIERQRAAVA